MASKNALAQYEQFDLASEVNRRNPEELISLLFEKCCSRLLQATYALEKNDLPAFHDSTTHATQIVLALRGILDMDNGGELAKQLHDTYTAIAQAIFATKKSKERKDVSKLYAAMSELKDGWEQLRTQSR